MAIHRSILAGGCLLASLLCLALALPAWPLARLHTARRASALRRKMAAFTVRSLKLGGACTYRTSGCPRSPALTVDPRGLDGTRGEAEYNSGQVVRWSLADIERVSWWVFAEGYNGFHQPDEYESVRLVLRGGRVIHLVAPWGRLADLRETLVAHGMQRRVRDVGDINGGLFALMAWLAWCIAAAGAVLARERLPASVWPGWAVASAVFWGASFLRERAGSSPPGAGPTR